MTTSLPILKQHQTDWKNCTKCQIGEWAHRKVFFRGDIPCDILFIGEAPGKTEDLLGLPFVGRAGHLFDEWLQEIVEPRKLKYCITNLTLCRPTDRRGGKNRAPYTHEIHNCSERLSEFIDIASPKLIVTVGRPARDHVAFTKAPIKSITHPAWANYNGGSGSRADAMCRTKLRKLVEGAFPCQ